MQVRTGPQGRHSKTDKMSHPRVNVDANLLQTKTRSQSKVLQVRVMHHTVVAHQHFAQQLIKWLEKIIEFSGKALLILSQGKNAALLFYMYVLRLVLNIYNHSFLQPYGIP